VNGALQIRPLGAADLADYKRLRDDLLALHPEAFTSDADSEAKKEASDYLHRLGLDRSEGGHFVLGAWRGRRLVGAIGCERELRLKVRHIGHVIGMMVRPEARGRGIGALLLESCIAEARHAGLEMLTLSVTAENEDAIRLYDRHGFVAYGTLERALKIGQRYYDKLHMALALAPNQSR
jgi:ribosomal protein S18 acetylase RimI-like enzyme